MEEKSIKLVRKCMRKQKRAQHRLARDMDIKCSDKPTRYLAVCNAGLVTGLKREIFDRFIMDAVSNYQLIMPPGKSYCFVDFLTIEEATNFYDKVHGKLQVPNQNTLFYLLYIETITYVEEPKPRNLAEGLRLLTDFVTPEEEATLLQCIDWENEALIKESLLRHRQVKHFKRRFKYENNLVDLEEEIEPLPKECEFLSSLFKKHGCGHYEYDQITVNRYLPGQGIPPHVDTHSIFEDTILILSLGSDCVMDFKQARSDEKFILDLPARSLLVMSGESRYGWYHGICPRHNDNIQTDSGLTTRPRGIRVSFAFRKIRLTDCRCDFSMYCDSQNEARYQKITSMNTSDASELEKSCVHSVYQEISSHFNETRHKPWLNVTKFIETVESGGLVLDVGCGNGKYLQEQTNVFKMGCDRSTGLAEICRSRDFQITIADCLQLPYRSCAFDAVICIAVIHHLSTAKRRKEAVIEIMRILRTSGRALIYVWAKEQTKDSEKSTYLKFNTKNKKKKSVEKKKPLQLRTLANNLTLPVHKNRTEFMHSDVLVPWKQKCGKELLRFYHVFKEGELEELCMDVPNTKTERVYYDQGNWCAVLRKL